MSPADPDPKPYPGSRMHSDGRLSFRRRVPEIDDPDLPLRVAGEEPPALADLVPDGFKAVEIEVGPGKGTYIVAATEARPETFLLGIEAAGGYAKFAAEKLKKCGRRNALLLVDNAKAFLKEQVPDGGLDRLHVYFPDPWPKRRHRRRRFFTEEMPEVVHRVLKPGGYLLVASDNPALSGEIVRVLGSSVLLRRDLEEEAKLRGMGPGHGFSPTSFERKYIEQGRIIRRYAFARTELASSTAHPADPEGFGAGI